MPHPYQRHHPATRGERRACREAAHLRAGFIGLHRRARRTPRRIRRAQAIGWQLIASYRHRPLPLA
jgi:hypothetical protein